MCVDKNYKLSSLLTKNGDGWMLWETTQLDDIPPSAMDEVLAICFELALADEMMGSYGFPGKDGSQHSIVPSSNKGSRRQGIEEGDARRSEQSQ